MLDPWIKVIPTGYDCHEYWVKTKENWIQGGGKRVSVHFAVTILDYWRTRFCLTTIIKIVNNNTNDKQTLGASLALDEDSPYTNSSCLFTLDRCLYYCCYAKTSSSVVQKRHSKVYGNPLPPPCIQFSLIGGIPPSIFIRRE